MGKCYPRWVSRWLSCWISTEAEKKALHLEAAPKTVRFADKVQVHPINPNQAPLTQSLHVCAATWRPLNPEFPSRRRASRPPSPTFEQYMERAKPSSTKLVALLCQSLYEAAKCPRNSKGGRRERDLVHQAVRESLRELEREWRLKRSRDENLGILLAKKWLNRTELLAGRRHERWTREIFLEEESYQLKASTRSSHTVLLSPRAPPKPGGVKWVSYRILPEHDLERLLKGIKKVMKKRRIGQAVDHHFRIMKGVK